MKQDDDKSPTSYYKRFINALEVCESQFGPLIPETIIERLEDYDILNEADLEIERERQQNNKKGSRRKNHFYYYKTAWSNRAQTSVTS